MAQKPQLKQIVHTWMYMDTDFMGLVKKVKAAGADGMDLTLGNDPRITAKQCLGMDVQKIMRDNGLSIECCTISYRTPDLDFSSPDPNIRKNAVEFTNRCVDAVAHAGCDRVLVSPSKLMLAPTYNVSREEDWKCAVEGIRQAGEYAAKQNVMLLLEPINHFAVALLHTVSQALRMIREIDLPNIHIVPDTFHMNFEEVRGVAGAIYRGGEHIKCLHIGDNTRRSAGLGSLDWRAIIGALYDIGFDGPLSFEPVFTGYDGEKMVKDPVYLDRFNREIKQGIAYLRTIQENLMEDEEFY